MAQAAGHVGRHTPLRQSCTGLLLPGQRNSVEPIAACLSPDNVRRTHPSLHHLVADAPWSDEALLARVRTQVLPAMQKQGPVVAWIVDDTGFTKKGRHSVGVTRQDRGQLDKQENCLVAVSLSVATASASLPIAYRLYLPECWAKDPQRRRQAGVADEIAFRTKPQIALEQIRQAVEEDVPRGVVPADAGYGTDGQFRAALTELDLQYVVGVRSSMTVRAPGTLPPPPKRWSGQGCPPR
ncbi:MAG: IS701 family transposase [Thermogutta sp.]